MRKHSLVFGVACTDGLTGGPPSFTKPAGMRVRVGGSACEFGPNSIEIAASRIASAQ